MQDRLSIEATNGEWVVFATSRCPDSLLKTVMIEEPNREKGAEKENVVLVEIYFATPPSSNTTPGFVGEIWNEVIGQPFIPFDETERKRNLEKSYRVLKEYLSFYL